MDNLSTWEIVYKGKGLRCDCDMQVAPTPVSVVKSQTSKYAAPSRMVRDNALPLRKHITQATHQLSSDKRWYLCHVYQPAILLVRCERVIASKLSGIEPIAVECCPSISYHFDRFLWGDWCSECRRWLAMGSLPQAWRKEQRYGR